MTKVREIATVLFYDHHRNIYLQTRGSASKYGEKYGLWGGGINPSETPLDALKRELKEELGLDIQSPQFFTKFELQFPAYDAIVYMHVFYSLVDFDPDSLTVAEGEGFHIAPLDDLLVDPDIGPNEHRVLSEFKTFLNQQSPN